MPADRALSKASDEARTEFARQMDDDFNAAGGVAALFGLVSAANHYLAAAGEDVSTAATLRAADTLAELAGVLGLTLESSEDSGLPTELVGLAAELAGYEGNDAEEAAQVLIDTRAAARAAKDWGTADAIRNSITALGLVLEDTAAGSRLKRA